MQAIGTAIQRRHLSEAGGEAGRPDAGPAPAGRAFTPEENARNFAYYEALTVRDSSLCACTEAVVAAEVGRRDLAYDYLGEAALVDLEDLKQTPGA